MHGYKVLTEEQLQELEQAAREHDIRDIVCEIRRLNHHLRTANERAAIAGRERDEAVALCQAMARLANAKGQRQ